MKRNNEGETVVLVAVLKSRRDLRILREERWYRIPERYAPKRKFWYLAFYQPAVFGREGKRIRYYAQVLSRSTVSRIELLPRERMHPRAHEGYVRLTIGALRYLPRPIRNTAPRRISFCFTTLKRLVHSKTILELYNVARTEEILQRALRRAGIAAVPQYYVRAGKNKRYYLDFAVFAGSKAIAIECDNIKAHSWARQRERDRIKDAFLRRRGWSMFRFTERDIVSDVEACMARIWRVIQNRTSASV